jgi:hypothetical protein
MRVIVIAFLIGLLAPLHAADRRSVDLGAPGVLEAIEKANPEHYRKITEIIRVSEEVSCETLPGMLKVQFGVSRTRCAGALILTSYPAKRHLAFTLDDIDYTTNVVLRNFEGKLMPAK